MFLEVWIEGERVGSHASEMARAVRFTSQDPRDKAAGKPELVLYTLDLEDYGYVRNLNLYGLSVTLPLSCCAACASPGHAALALAINCCEQRSELESCC